jgi:hypothetical protein
MNTFKMLFCLLMLGTFTALAQEETKKDTTYWTTKYALGINLNQAAFSDNWTGGGVSSISVGTALNFRPSYKKDKITWNTEFDLIYGAVRNKGQSARKSADRFLFDSKVGYNLSEKWNVFFGANFLTQIAPGYDFSTDSEGNEQRAVISKIMNPAYLTYGFGMEYVPVKWFKIRVSPLSPRHTFVTDTTLYRNVPRNYGVEIGSKVRNEWGGFQLWSDLDKDIMENLNLKTRYFMFGNYENGKLDHRLDLILTAKVNKYLNVNLSGILLYDEDQSSEVQFSQVLAIGFLLKK